MSKVKDDFGLEERLIGFAVRIIQLAEAPPKSLAGNPITEQFVRHLRFCGCFFLDAANPV